MHIPRPAVPIVIGALVALAACAPSPDRFSVERPLRAGPAPGDTFGVVRPPPETGLPAHPADPTVEPGLVMVDRMPTLVNRNAFVARVDSAYPDVLTTRPENLRVGLLIFIDERGLVIARSLRESSGTPLLDAAALNVIEHARFAPAALGAEPVGVWVAFPLDFGVARRGPAGP